MKRDYDGPPIDGTEQYISERDEDGETVGGTSDDDRGDETVVDWPDAVPREPFERGEYQTQIVEKLAIKDRPDPLVAERVGCTRNTVRAVRNKVSVFAKPGDVSFRIPVFPGTGYSIVDKALRHEEARFDANSADELDRGAYSVDEIARRRYADHESLESIAADLGIEVARVRGKLSNYQKEEGSGQTTSAAGGSDPESDGPDCDWPEILPLAHFTSLQQKIICYLMDNPLASQHEVAAQVGTEPKYVTRVVDKASIWADPDDVPFPARKVPGRQRNRDMAENVGIELPEKDGEVKPLFSAQLSNVSAEEIARRHYEEGEASVSIANDLGVSQPRIAKILKGYKEQSESEGSAQDPTKVDADSPEEAVPESPPSPVSDRREEGEMATRADGGRGGWAAGQFVKVVGAVLAVWKLYDILTGRDSA